MNQIKFPCLISILILLIFIKDSFQYANTDCGITNELTINSENGKVVGGYDVGYFKYPWFVAMHSRSSRIFVCAGTLITRRHVLSAAHCFIPNSSPPENIYNYYLGVSNACKLNEQKDRIKVYTADAVHIHEKYTENTIIYDIALIILNTTVEGFSPICLPFKSVTPHNPSEGTVIGLGMRKPDTITSLACELQEARILIYPESTCKSVLHSHEVNELQHIDTLVCAGYLKGGIDSCQGDSGGPFQIVGRNNRIILQGIVSFGWGCASPNTLGFYTNVGKYMGWITSKVSGRKPPPTNSNKWQNNYYQYLLWYNNYIKQFYT